VSRLSFYFRPDCDEQLRRIVWRGRQVGEGKKKFACSSQLLIHAGPRTKHGSRRIEKGSWRRQRASLELRGGERRGEDLSPALPRFVSGRQREVSPAGPSDHHDEADSRDGRADTGAGPYGDKKKVVGGWRAIGAPRVRRWKRLCAGVDERHAVAARILKIEERRWEVEDLGGLSLSSGTG